MIEIKVKTEDLKRNRKGKSVYSVHRELPETYHSLLLTITKLLAFIFRRLTGMNMP